MTHPTNIQQDRARAIVYMRDSPHLSFRELARAMSWTEHRALGVLMSMQRQHEAGNHD